MSDQILSAFSKSLEVENVFDLLALMMIAHYQNVRWRMEILLDHQQQQQQWKQQQQRGFGVFSGRWGEVVVVVVLPLLPEQILPQPPESGGGRRRGGGVVQALGLVGR